MSSRAIEGIPQITLLSSFAALFENGIQSLNPKIPFDHLRLLIAYWLNGITCYALEDLYLGICVVMDIVKQIEKNALNTDFTFYKGMESACNRFGLPILSHDYTNMRNDLVHEGKLSGANFSNKSKEDCAEIISSVLNWIDKYFVEVLNINNHVIADNRFKLHDVVILPSFSIYGN